MKCFTKKPGGEVPGQDPGSGIAHLPAPSRSQDANGAQKSLEIQPVPFGIGQGLGHTGHDTRQSDLIGYFCVLPEPCRAFVADVASQRFKKGQAGFKVSPFSADHNSEGTVSRPGISAAYRRIQGVQPLFQGTVSEIRLLSWGRVVVISIT